MKALEDFLAVALRLAKKADDLRDAVERESALLEADPAALRRAIEAHLAGRRRS